MFFLRRPTPEQVQTVLEQQRQSGYTSPEVGQTRAGLHPAGYAPDRHTARLGSGDDCFERAGNGRPLVDVRDALDKAHESGRAVRRGVETLVVQVRHLGFYSLIPDRVVYTLDEPERFGFGYGTLPGHAEQGEERFLVTRSASGEVAFELHAFSEPRHLLATLGTPVVRRLQRAAAEAYTAAMRRATPP